MKRAVDSHKNRLISLSIHTNFRSLCKPYSYIFFFSLSLPRPLSPNRYNTCTKPVKYTAKERALHRLPYARLMLITASSPHISSPTSGYLPPRPPRGSDVIGCDRDFSHVCLIVKRAYKMVWNTNTYIHAQAHIHVTLLLLLPLTLLLLFFFFLLLLPLLFTLSSSPSHSPS